MSENREPSLPADIDPGLDDFLELFRQRRYWESHEALEGPWRDHGSRFYKGLILYASAFVHVDRGNTHGIEAQLRKAMEQLGPYVPTYLGFDVAGILDHARRCLAIVASNQDVEAEAWPRLIPRPVLRWEAGRVRGDEPELGTASRARRGGGAAGDSGVSQSRGTNPTGP